MMIWARVERRVPRTDGALRLLVDRLRGRLVDQQIIGEARKQPMCEAACQGGLGLEIGRWR